MPTNYQPMHCQTGKSDRMIIIRHRRERGLSGSYVSESAAIRLDALPNPSETMWRGESSGAAVGPEWSQEAVSRGATVPRSVVLPANASHKYSTLTASEAEMDSVKMECQEALDRLAKGQQERHEEFEALKNGRIADMHGLHGEMQRRISRVRTGPPVTI